MAAMGQPGRGYGAEASRHVMQSLGLTCMLIPLMPTVCPIHLQTSLVAHNLAYKH